MDSRKTRTVFGVAIAAAIALMLFVLPGAASARDRNHDRIPDRWEKHHRLSLHKNQAKRDQDHDGLRNRGEFRAGDDPRDPDSDNDGTEDGEEGAGTISDITDGVLTINLFNGGSVSGLVTADTEVECDNGDDQGDEDNDGEGGRHGDTGDGDNQGDLRGENSGPGSENSGPGSVEDNDDQGEDNDDQGDDDDQGEDDERECSADDLAVGAVVQEAELELENGQAVFEEIELSK